MNFGIIFNFNRLAFFPRSQICLNRNLNDNKSKAMMGVSAQATSAAALLVVLAAAFCALPSNAFVVLPAADRLAADQSSSSTISIARPSAFSHASSSSISSSSTVLYMAAEGKKKRRRKRKDGKTPSAGSGESPSVPIVSDDGELPGFDLGDDEQVEEFKMEPTKAEAPANAASASMEASEVAMASDPSDASVDMSNPKVMEAMKGSMPGVASAGSTEDLLRNRDLEKSFKFDDTNVKEDLPSLGQLAGKKGRGGGVGSTEPSSPGSFVVEQKVGSKRARAEARRAAAIEAERAAEEEKSFLQKVPQFLDEKGEVSPIKILESGTWVGIGILVLWEVYINSPFFERAAPMAPVVYELLF